MLHRFIALATVAVFSTAVTASARDIKLPPTMAVTAYDTGTSGFNIAVAVGRAQQRCDWRYHSDIANHYIR